MPSHLTVNELRVSYGQAVAVDGVALEVHPGSVRVLLGPNGAGKSSTLNGICGVVPRRGGEIMLGDVALHRLRAHDVARRGVIQVPEGRRVVGTLTVEENLELGRYPARGRGDDGPYSTTDSIYELFPNLASRRSVRAGLLSGGEQQMLAIGRGLMGSPAFMLLDEPSMGLAPNLVDLVLERVATIAASGIGVLMVEQNVAALDIASYGYILDRGRIVAEASAGELAADPAVVEAYIGRHRGSDGGSPRA